MTRIVLVTGGNRGIGLAIARKFQVEGDTVIVTSRSGDPIEGLNVVKCDVSSSESVDQAFTEIEEKFGPVQVAVANAGITKDGLIMRMSDEDINEVINTNLIGAIRVARRATKNMMKARSGRIIFISSVVGLMGSAGQVNYAASKAGLVGAARSLARELGSRGVTANVIAPGFIDTEMTAELPAERKAEILANVPLGRYGSTEEIAEIVKFIASTQAGYISGAVIPVDGGLGMGH
jgi:NAD(P)-dependent dehydrogenase (short-subunit alcohol dehydrogenase family)